MLEIIQSLLMFFKKGGKRRVDKSENNLKNGRGKRRIDVFHIFDLVEKGALVNLDCILKSGKRRAAKFQF